MTQCRALVTDLRTRFRAAQGARPLMHIFWEMGLTYHTLRRFALGQDIPVRHLEKIEAWCDTQERRAQP